jgi:hypothetical protein
MRRAQLSVITVRSKPRFRSRIERRTDILNAGLPWAIIIVTGFIPRSRVRRARSGMAGIWRRMKIVIEAGARIVPKTR